MDTASRPDPSRCPLCGESNRCVNRVDFGLTDGVG